MIKSLTIRLLFDWVDIYPATRADKVYGSPNANEEVSITNTGNVWMHDCIFKAVGTTANDGIIVDKKSSKLLIEMTSFISCYSASASGILYRSTTTGESALHKICSYESYSTLSSSCAQFCDITSKDDINFKNDLEQSSIVYSNRNPTHGSDTFRITKGFARLDSNNVSHNSVNFWSFGKLTSSIVTSVCSTITLTSIVNNTAKNSGCLGLISANGIYLIKDCNIIANDAGTGANNAIIMSNARNIVTNTCIIGNKYGEYIFNFASNTENIFVDCILESIKCFGTTALIQGSCTSFINAIKLRNTYLCIAKLDSYGDLTCNVPFMHSCKLEHNQIFKSYSYTINVMVLLSS